MEKVNNQPKLTAIAPAAVLKRGFTWVNTRWSLVRVKKFTGITSVFMLPVFMLGLVFMALVIALFLTLLLLYAIFHFLLSLPRLKKASRPL